MSELGIPATQNVVPDQAVPPQVVKPVGPKKNKAPLAIAALVVILGIGTGWLLSGGLKGSTGGQKPTEINKTTKEAGIEDESAFPLTEEGVLESGGLDGEGTHHLIRPGGDSQTVYLTSSVFNLDDFVGQKVKIWGNSTSSKNVGYLFDVGKIRVLD